MTSWLESIFHTEAWYSNLLIGLCWIYIFVMVPYIGYKAWQEGRSDP